ncbi:hypothetical protein GPUN_1751 [Glaciecola punicea ACAM 611]|uniref:Uncharacterized protein n=1 Tax=Glaciecola punicea ACAM 611 TaxID=1121923 RepID=H5TC40_9ALTE|nr:hypothetical protein GPUN_1751 [Glaciecola punicea ACAM 611]
MLYLILRAPSQSSVSRALTCTVRQLASLMLGYLNVGISNYSNL